MSVRTYILMRQRVLSSKAVQTDDTPVPVLDPELPRTRISRIWTYIGDADHPCSEYRNDIVQRTIVAVAGDQYYAIERSKVSRARALDADLVEGNRP